MFWKFSPSPAGLYSNTQMFRDALAIARFGKINVIIFFVPSPMPAF